MNQWTTEDSIVAQHSNTQASAMSVNALGDLVVLGSRRHLTLIELKEPQKVVRRVHLTNKWDISHLFWNPSVAHNNFILTTYNQWADVWRFDEGMEKCVAQLKGHTRAISDADWSAVNPNLCATCSLDTYIYIWDSRDLKRHKFAISTVSGSGQVKWNKINANYLSTAHDGNIRVWDIRNVKTAMHYITAHLSKINYLDWDPNHEHTLASASQDSTIKLWNTSETPRKAELQMTFKHPVWKLSYTPFGSGLVSVELANFRETPLTLWNVNEPDQPVHSFVGHNDVILGYHIAKSKSDTNWKLVTWCKDQTLQINNLDQNLLYACGMSKDSIDHVPEDEEVYNLMHDVTTDEKEPAEPIHPVSNVIQSSNSSVESNVSLVSGSYKSVSHEYPDGFMDNTPSESYQFNKSLTISSPATSMHSLEQEFKLLNVSLPNLRLDEVDLSQRTCSVSLRTPVFYAWIKISFPPTYPHNEPPMFLFSKNNLSGDAIAKLKLTLQETAQHHVRNNRSCLEPCLRQLTTQFSDISYHSEDDKMSEAFDPPTFSFANVLRNHQFYAMPNNIPFPRTSGARFCSVGYLVIFLRPAHVRGFQSVNEKTPRSFSSLTTHRNSTPSVFPMYRSNSSVLNQISTSQFSTSPNQPPDLSVRTFYYKQKRPSRKMKNFSHLPYYAKDQEISSSLTNYETKPQQYAGHVVINDLTRVMPVSRQLAEQYLIPSKKDFVEACLHNKKNATKEEMDDLVELWSCVSLLPKPEGNRPVHDNSGPFACSPMGKTFLNKLIQHYCVQYDVQTLAMLACTFASSLPAASQPQSGDMKTVTDMKRSASYDTFRITERNAKEKGETGKIQLLYKSLLARSPPGHSYMENARSTASSPTEQRPLLLEPKPKRPIGKKPDYRNIGMLSAEQQKRFDAFKNSYSDILLRWKLNVKKAEIQKFSTNSGRKQSTLEFKATCQSCGESCKSTCRKKKNIYATCSICQLPVKSLLVFCNECMHGGHRDHMIGWFKNEKMCPTSCGCNCGQMFDR
uniref:ZF(RING)-3 zinc finger protein n=1 Tax=Phallusia mammillata TaxID=59560 RepID=A0A6F9DW88_9ASCI|nr:ZF(RING)-3 zinc finger protein [Phallusia mammillata]